jgi:NAD(P)-dependent dehydrogenase (short-subunit alcohol dehydrogenase family)
MRLQDKVVVITGAASGIGRSCAEAAAREGAQVVVADRDEAGGRAVAEAITLADGRAMFLPVDVADPASVETLIQQMLVHQRRLDVLICSAGIGARRLGDGPAHLCSLEAWDRVMAVNLRGTFLACKYALPHLIESRGNLVTIASVLGLVGTQGLFDTHAYAASKAGIIGLTRAIAADYARHGVRANVVAPGLIDTPMAARARSDPALLERVAAWQPLGALGRPQDVAEAVLFLVSDQAQFITGVVLPVDGGWTVQ